MKKYSIAIHGGAGNLDDVSIYKKSIYNILESLSVDADKGMSALDLAEKAVVKLENDPIFNAGKGSVIGSEGIVECDAAIMDGVDMDAGSVSAVRGIKNPISLSRKVMKDSPHVMLVSEGANEFAKSLGISIENNDYFLTEARIEQLKQAKKTNKIVLDHSDTSEEKMGTVGAVVIDSDGNLAAATSTGGIVNKKFGRIGDSSVVGAGVFAENRICAVSATGYGEQFLRTSLSKHIAEYIRYTKSDAQSAAKEGIDFLVSKVNGLGGVIVIDSNYNIGYAHSTSVILAGSIKAGEKPNLFF